MKLHPDKCTCIYMKIRPLFLNVWRLIALIFTIVVAFSILLLCKAYIHFVLLWLENQDGIVIAVTISVLFVLVALPVSIGYIVLVVAEGYLFGILRGLLLVVIGANLGLFVAHNILKLLRGHRSVYRYTQNETAQAILRVIAGPLCFKIVLCSRLTPIPFGLQNTIFALSDVKAKVYHLASLIGLLPAQIVGLYFGSTLRSMQDVLESRHISSWTYIFISIQLILAIALMIWFSTKARTELLRVLAEAEDSSSSSSSSMTNNSLNKSSGFSIV